MHFKQNVNKDMLLMFIQNEIFNNLRVKDSLLLKSELQRFKYHL